jgi:eukaryotic-like serine/threonine-protein kinase
MPLSTGQVLNQRYRVDAQIGQGGSGAVYSAWDLNLNTPVAIKEQLFASAQAGQLFTQQARALASLRHPNLPYVIDHFNIPSQGQYLVIEYIKGQDLQSMLRHSGQSLPETQAVTWIQQALDGLAYLHAQTPPVLHRDIKPANIRITPSGKAVLVDYGMGLAYDSNDAATLISGSPFKLAQAGNAYTALEMYTENGDARSDLYAMGATLYTILTGRPPLDALKRHQGQILPSLRQVNPELSTGLEAVVLKALELAPERRFQRAEEMRSALGLLASSALARTVAYASPAPPAAASVQPVPPTIRIEQEPARQEIHLPPKPAARRSGLIWLVVAVIAVLCLVSSIAGGVGAYVFVLATPVAPSATPVSIDQAVNATRTALAKAASPTASLTAIVILPVTPGVPSPLPPTQPPPPSLAPTLPPTFTNVPSPTLVPSQTPSLKPTWFPCTGTYASRLHSGDRAFVSYDPPLANRVRAQPNIAATIVGMVQPGEQMDIIGGPICSDQWIWWQIRTLASGVTGWTAEGDKAGYWLLPLQ